MYWLQRTTKKIASSLKRQIFRTVANEGLQKLYQTLNIPGAGHNLIILYKT